MTTGGPPGGYNALIDDIVAGRWVNPETGEPVRVPYRSVVIAETLDGREADLVAPLDLGDRLAVVADETTYAALGERVARALRPIAHVETVVLDRPHADVEDADRLAERLRGADGVVAVGSGTLNDLCKHVTAGDGRGYCVFGTAASMNGYTSTTASMMLPSGLKVSLPAHAPRGFFADIAVAAAAPKHLAAAGFGDCLCRSTAQIDWWLSHRLLSTAYRAAPYLIQAEDERRMNANAAGIGKGDIAAIGYLYRVLTLCGLGVSFTGMSNHGSMGEHQISHYIDCFAGSRHPGTLHGAQVGIASLTMARLQSLILDRETPPVVGPTRIDMDDMARRMGSDVAAECAAEWRKKALDADAADRLNARMAELWPDLRHECAAFALPAAEMAAMLEAAGGPTTAGELRLKPDLYAEAVLHCREMRERFSVLDVAADAGFLADFAADEAGR